MPSLKFTHVSLNMKKNSESVVGLEGSGFVGDLTAGTKVKIQYKPGPAVVYEWNGKIHKSKGMGGEIGVVRVKRDSGNERPPVKGGGGGTDEVTITVDDKSPVIVPVVLYDE